MHASGICRMVQSTNLETFGGLANYLWRMPKVWKTIIKKHVLFGGLLGDKYLLLWTYVKFGGTPLETCICYDSYFVNDCIFIFIYKRSFCLIATHLPPLCMCLLDPWTNHFCILLHNTYVLCKVYMSNHSFNLHY